MNNKATMYNKYLWLVPATAICLLASLSTSTCEAKRLNYESVYRDGACSLLNGKTEVRVKGDRRASVDCETDTHAIEVDFSDKWAEAIGQSAYYSVAQKKRQGIILIIEDTNFKNKRKGLKRLSRLTKTLIGQNTQATVWVMFSSTGQLKKLTLYKFD